MAMTVNQEIKDAAKEKRLVIGSRTVFKGLKKGNLKNVIYSSNCPDAVKEDLKYYTKVSGVKIEEFKGNSDKLGETCKKPFNILILGIKKS